MAGTDGTKTYPLGERLAEMAATPHAFDFYQALRLMECQYAHSPRLGTSRRPADDPVRLSQEASLTFESATLTRFTPESGGAPHRLWVRWLGLLGPNGPLPLHITEYIQECKRDLKDDTFAAFLDLFHHRMLSFFYRAWADTEPCVSYDRPETDRFSDYMAALFGLGMDSLRNRDEISDRTKLFYGGRLAAQTRTPEGLEAILGDYFELPVSVEEFVGEWMALPPEQQSRLGIGLGNATLGENLILGSRVWDTQHKFRIHLGPMDLEAYQRLLPSGDQVRRFVSLVRNYCGDELDWDLNLMLHPEAVPPTRLDGTNRMGWTSWLGQRPVQVPARELILNVLNHAALR